MRRKKLPITEMKQDIAVDPVGVKRREGYYEQLYTHQFENLDEVD